MRKHRWLFGDLVLSEHAAYLARMNYCLIAVSKLFLMIQPLKCLK